MGKRSTRASELETELKREIGQALEQVRTQGAVLEVLGRMVQELLDETSRYEGDDELRARAWRVRSGVRHAATIAFEIEAAAGVLEGLVNARTSVTRHLEPVT